MKLGLLLLFLLVGCAPPVPVSKQIQLPGKTKAEVQLLLGLPRFTELKNGEELWYYNDGALMLCVTYKDGKVIEYYRY
jgi:antitoxin component YwqK of YwqJK toxin-antitoxin module